jgi:hypothetical protein
LSCSLGYLVLQLGADDLRSSVRVLLDQVDEIHQRFLLDLNGLLFQGVRNGASSEDSLMDGAQCLGLTSFVILLEGLGIAFIAITVDKLFDLRNGEDVVVCEVELLGLVLQLLLFLLLFLLSELLDLFGSLVVPVVSSGEGVFLVLLHDLLRNRIDSGVEGEVDLLFLLLLLFNRLDEGNLLGLRVTIKLLGVRIGVLGINALGVQLALDFDNIRLISLHCGWEWLIRGRT